MKKRLSFLTLAALSVSFAQDVKQAEPAAAPVVARVILGVIPGQMKFDKTEFEVTAGQKVMLLIKNDRCPLSHNLVICKPGTKDKVAGEALKFSADPNAMKANFIPPSPDIIFKSNKLVMAGQSDLIEFIAPADAGDYPFVCVYPGHSDTMHGIMRVKK